MRELKNSEIEAVCGGAKARPVCGGPVAVPVRKPSPFEALVISVLSKIFGIRTPVTKEAA